MPATPTALSLSPALPPSLLAAVEQKPARPSLGHAFVAPRERWQLEREAIFDPKVALPSIRSTKEMTQPCL